MIFDSITADQITSIHILFKFLRKLRIIGLIKTNVRPIPLTEMGRPTRYTITYSSYDHSYKNRLTPEEALDELFRESESLGLRD